MKLANTIAPFQGFIKHYIDSIKTAGKLNHFEHIKNLEQSLAEGIMKICSRTLIYLLNEKRIQGELIGETPEARYHYFDCTLAEKGQVLQEIQERFPEIHLSLSEFTTHYLNLLAEIKQRFNDDQTILKENILIKEQDQTIQSIKIVGDLHGEKAVALVELEQSTIVYKPKSLANEKFLNEFLILINSLLEKQSPKLAINQHLDCGNYGWVRYLEKKPLLIKEVEPYYRKTGYLLMIAYFLNISDLHHENIMSSGKEPYLIDIETLFSTSIMKPTLKDLATEKINDDVLSSVMMTGMLPIKAADGVFGGDVSGIFGGKFTNIKRVMENLNRDDMKIIKKLESMERTDHLPYYLVKENQTQYANPYANQQHIKEGFSEMYQLIVNHKKKILEFVEKTSQHLKTRLLARNTAEYSVLIEAAMSPIYASNRTKLFDKLKEK